MNHLLIRSSALFQNIWNQRATYFLKTFKTYHCLSLIFIISHLSCAEETIIVDNLMMTGGNSGDQILAPTQTMLNSPLILRIFPTDLSGDAEVYCEAVAIQESLIVTAAHCFDRGVAFAEVYGGSYIEIQNTLTPPVIASQVYVHPAYQPNAPSTLSNDIALVSLQGVAPGSVIAPFPAVEDTNTAAFFRIGYQVQSAGVFNRVIKVAPPLEITAGEIIFGDPFSPICSLGGGPVLFSYQGQDALLGINTRGGPTCTENGAALRIDTHASFIQTSLSNPPMLSGGLSGVITPKLTCAQTLLCHTPACQQFVEPGAHEQARDLLFVCANGAGCTSPECYPMVCPTEYQTCVSGTSSN